MYHTQFFKIILYHFIHNLQLWMFFPCPFLVIGLAPMTIINLLCSYLGGAQLTIFPVTQYMNVLSLQLFPIQNVLFNFWIFAI